MRSAFGWSGADFAFQVLMRAYVVFFCFDDFLHVWLVSAYFKLNWSFRLVIGDRRYDGFWRRAQ